jgi:hypothetical protein
MALTVSDIYQLLPKELTSCPHHRPVAESKFCAPLRATTAKLDIESGEFELLPHLLRQTDGSAAICAIDFWLIEWHLWRSTLTESRSRFEVRRTIDQKIAAACPSRSVPAIVDHEERMSIHPPSPPTSPPPPPPPPQ